MVAVGTAADMAVNKGFVVGTVVDTAVHKDFVVDKLVDYMDFPAENCLGVVFEVADFAVDNR